MDPVCVRATMQRGEKRERLNYAWHQLASPHPHTNPTSSRLAGPCLLGQLANLHQPASRDNPKALDQVTRFPLQTSPRLAPGRMLQTAWSIAAQATSGPYQHPLEGIICGHRASNRRQPTILHTIVLFTRKLFPLFALGITLGLFASTTASAQNPEIALPSPLDQRMAIDTESVIELLALEGAVADTVRALLAERAEMLTKMREKVRANRRGQRQVTGGARELLQAIDNEINKKLANVLTEEQMEVYAAFRAEQRRDRRRDPRR